LPLLGLLGHFFIARNRARRLLLFGEEEMFEQKKEPVPSSFSPSLPQSTGRARCGD
jgi:hypothetical protein